MINGFDAASIKPIESKKSISLNDLTTIIKDRFKDWYSSDDPEENKEIQQRKAIFLWQTLL